MQGFGGGFAVDGSGFGFRVYGIRVRMLPAAEFKALQQGPNRPLARPTTLGLSFGLKCSLTLLSGWSSGFKDFWLQVL